MSVVFALDAWDRKLIAAAKSEGDRLNAVRHVWGERVGMSPEAVPIGAVVRRLAEIVDGLQVATLPQLLENASLMQLSEPSTAFAKVVDSVIKGDFQSAKDQALRGLERAHLLPPTASTPVSSPFIDTWFWTLLNAIQCAPREKFAMPCSA